MRAFCFTGLAALVSVGCAACASNDAKDERWIAKGWLTPTPQGQPEIIGEFDDQAACEAALDEWLQSQVVGNPVHGECLPA